jgi:phosphate transport system permease protein
MTVPSQPASSALLTGSKQRGRWFHAVCLISTWSSVVVLAVLLAVTIYQGGHMLSWKFLTSYNDAIDPAQSGMYAGIVGSLLLMLLTMLLAVPIGLGSAIYLEEYATDTWLVRLVRVNLSNLAGIPSIVYGILGLGVFVRFLGLLPNGSRMIILGQIVIPIPFGPTLIAGACTLSLLILPLIIVATQEALRAVPQSIRHASQALGATKWQTISRQVLPAAIPGILTGVILSLSRAMGETAPLIMIGAATFLRDYKPGLFAPFTAMPMEIYSWAKRSQPAFRALAPAGIIVLLVILLALNGVAIYLRNRAQKNVRW